MNITLMRQTRESILDTSKPFDMSHWGQCIAAHAVCIAHPERSLNGDDPHTCGLAGPHAQELLGLTDAQRSRLFHRSLQNWGMLRMAMWDKRRAAASMIDEMIGGEEGLTALRNRMVQEVELFLETVQDVQEPIAEPERELVEV